MQAHPHLDGLGDRNFPPAPSLLSAASLPASQRSSVFAEMAADLSNVLSLPTGVTWARVKKKTTHSPYRTTWKRAPCGDEGGGRGPSGLSPAGAAEDSHPQDRRPGQGVTGTGFPMPFLPGCWSGDEGHSSKPWRWTSDPWGSNFPQETPFKQPGRRATRRPSPSSLALPGPPLLGLKGIRWLLPPYSPLGGTPGHEALWPGG